MVKVEINHDNHKLNDSVILNIKENIISILKQQLNETYQYQYVVNTDDLNSIGSSFVINIMIKHKDIVNKEQYRNKL